LVPEDLSQLKQSLRIPSQQLLDEISVLEQCLFIDSGLLDLAKDKLPMMQLLDLLVKHEPSIWKVVLIKLYDYQVFASAIHEIRVLLNFSELDAQIVLLRHAVGFRPTQIAEFIGCPHSSVSRRNFTTTAITLAMLKQSKHFVALYWSVLRLFKKYLQNYQLLTNCNTVTASDTTVDHVVDSVQTILATDLLDIENVSIEELLSRGNPKGSESDNE
jgi:hypothetical protein